MRVVEAETAAVKFINPARHVDSRSFLRFLTKCAARVHGIDTRKKFGALFSQSVLGRSSYAS
jgi:hypothetical protein